MFLILLSYKKPLNEVDRFLAEHRQFLAAHYASGCFLLSGRNEPRTGGVILASATSKAEIESIVRTDPFYQEGIVEYEIVEFVPTMAGKALAHYVVP